MKLSDRDGRRAGGHRKVDAGGRGRLHSRSPVFCGVRARTVDAEVGRFRQLSPDSRPGRPQVPVP